MSRQARSVFANIPHHITQTGNRQGDVFFCDSDKSYYLQLLKKYTTKHQVQILAYCLMTNHIHLILKPSTEAGLQKALKPIHMRYSQYINKQQNTSGILWQGRFFSCALDKKYTYYAFAYVENNPVKAKMVENAQDYLYSSARYHLGLEKNDLLSEYDIGIQEEEYSDYLKNMYYQDNEILKRNTKKGLPCGSVGFVDKLGILAGRDLSFKGVGRPKKG